MMSRRERARPLLPNPDCSRSRFSSPEIPPLLGRPPLLDLPPLPDRAPLIRGVDSPPDYRNDFDEGYSGPFRETVGPLPNRLGVHERIGYHPYDKPGNPNIGRPRRLSSNGIPSLLDTKLTNKPPPLLPPQAIERLRDSLRSLDHSAAYDERDPDSEYMDPEEYMQEEEDTKKKIDHIIMVASALREKLDREEEIRQLHQFDGSNDCDNYNGAQPPFLNSPTKARSIIDEEAQSPPDPTKLPRLMDLKPKIPSLLDIKVAPPPFKEVARENVMSAINDYVCSNQRLEKCWNCDKTGHYYNDCLMPRNRMFCIRCGRPGCNVYSCPDCAIY